MKFALICLIEKNLCDQCKLEKKDEQIIFCKKKQKRFQTHELKRNHFIQTFLLFFHKKYIDCFLEMKANMEHLFVHPYCRTKRNRMRLILLILINRSHFPQDFVSR